MSFFDTVVIPMFSPPPPLKDGERAEEFARRVHALTDEDIEALLEAENYRRKHDGSL